MSRLHSLPSDAGTIFLETLVAAAIISLMLGTYFTITAQSARQVSKVEQRRMEYMVAQSRLARAGIETPLEIGTVSGIEQGYAWQVSVQPYADTRAESAAGRLVRVSATVKSGTQSKGGATLRTLRLLPDETQ